MNNDDNSVVDSGGIFWERSIISNVECVFSFLYRMSQLASNSRLPVPCMWKTIEPASICSWRLEGFHVHLLLAGEVDAIQGIPDDKDTPNVAEDGTVEAEGYKHW